MEVSTDSSFRSDWLPNGCPRPKKPADGCHQESRKGCWRGGRDVRHTGHIMSCTFTEKHPLPIANHSVAEHTLSVSNSALRGSAAAFFDRSGGRQRKLSAFPRLCNTTPHRASSLAQMMPSSTTPFLQLEPPWRHPHKAFIIPMHLSILTFAMTLDHPWARPPAAVPVSSWNNSGNIEGYNRSTCNT